MKKSLRSCATPCKFSETVQRRLGTYAMAASAAGVGLLALAEPAEAQIVYTPAHVLLRMHGVYQLDLTNNGSPELRFINSATPFVGRLWVSAWGPGGVNNKVEMGSLYVDALIRGANIGGSKHFYECMYGECESSNTPPKLAIAFSAGGDGPWTNVRNRYVGIQFPINGETHYGWARLSVIVEGQAIKAMLTGYAYEATANKPIPAGKMDDNADDDATTPQKANPESSPRQQNEPEPISRGLQSPTLGMLALGTQGLALW